MAYSINKYTLICTLVLFIVSATMILSVFNANGVGWDFLSRYLNGRMLASSYFYSHLYLFNRTMPVNATINGVTYTTNVTPSLVISKGFYFDDVWDPLTSFLIAIFVFFANGTGFELYMVFILALLFVSSYITAKCLDVNPLLLSSLIAAPFVISYTILYNGAEILALCMSLIAIGLAVKKDYKTGIFIGLAGLARYEALIISPIVFLLGDRKKTIKAILLGVLVTVPWFAFNYVLFGDPFQSYFTLLAETQPQNSSFGMFLSTMYSISWYPLALIIIAALVLLYLKHKKSGNRKKRDNVMSQLLKTQSIRVLSLSLFMAFLGFAFAFENAQGAIRIGYQVYLCLACIAAVALSAGAISKIKTTIKGRRLGEIIPYAVFLVTLLLMINIYYGWSTASFNILGTLGFRNTVYTNAVSALASHNLSNCSVVSNAWPYLTFYNVTTYTPYRCNATEEKMPIVVFNSTGVSNYCTGSISSLKNISETFKYTNFSISLPNNYVCVT